MSNHQSRNGMTKTATKVAAASGLVAIFGAAAAMGAPAAVADSTATTTSTPSATDVATQVRKSVTLSGNPDGSIISSASAMVTQVSSVGNGQAQVSVPVGADSARNLDGFSSVPVENQNAIFNMNPNGNQEQRIYTPSSDGPIRVKVTATLDGKPINPGEVVDKTGVLAVNYNVVNTQTEKQTVSYKDVNGNDVVSEVEMASPIGGSVDIILPQGFNEITATGASVGGDGTGATKLSYSLVLFEPLGNPVANFGYQTRIAAGTLPSAKFTFLPIIPMENSTIASTKEAYTGGAATGSTIHGAGVEIGENLTKLQDGAAKLTAGLIKAADGASQLAAGLNNTAVPGANKLAAGSSELASGLNETAVPGAEALASGAGELSEGLNDTAVPGANAVAAGASGLSAGLDQLAPGAQQVAGGLALLQQGIEALPATVQSTPEYQQAVAALGGLAGGLTAITAQTQAISTVLAGDFADAVSTYCAEATDPSACATDFGAVGTSIGTASGTINALVNTPGTLGTGVPSMVQLVGALQAGLPDLLGGIQASLLPSVTALAAGAAQVAGGTTSAAAGAAQLADGSSQLAEGLVGAADGASQLADGTSTLATGLVSAADGATQVADGAGQIAEGLVPAAEGASEIADGLPAAVDGTEQIESGAGQLRDEGSDKLAASGESAQADYAFKVAQINAIQQVGLSGSNIPYGPAVGPNTQTTGVYQLTLAPASTGASNSLVFGLAALGLVVAGAAGVFVWRRVH